MQHEMAKQLSARISITICWRIAAPAAAGGIAAALLSEMRL